METTSSIRLLASTNNARGDLFTRLVKDLFFALGYGDLRLDVHKSGREIDIQGTHRLEPRQMVAECKAHEAKMGGDELNKFFGVLTRERDRDERTPVSGYFVSLNGFRETGREQELQTSEQKRVILLDGKQVVDELVRSRILISPVEAVERAGRCASQVMSPDAVLDDVELLGHESGYLWAVFYCRNKRRTHFALIHADGTVLAERVASEIIRTDRECTDHLHELDYLPPPTSGPDRDSLSKTSLECYRRWLVAECGYIQLDGLPADADLSALRLKLERMFVALKLRSWDPAFMTLPGRDPEAVSMPLRTRKALYNRLMSSSYRIDSIHTSSQAVTLPTFSLGAFLAEYPRLSLLAKPGAGKSTLLKRLAVAYAAPHRRAEVDDGLPDRNWLPLLLRCRELRDRAHRPVRELLDDLSKHAGMSADETDAFRDQIDEALRCGGALLLVDGLDEISDEGARSAFADHLRTFIAIFPGAAIVVTSREAGYRRIAGVIAGACEPVGLAPFDESDVRQLCESWHAEVVGNNEKVRAEARQLAAIIWNNERIRALAENPLMLTTLLVVKRNVGELPTRRAKLYRAAVDVLIRTWNVEGYEPLDEEETLARLSYVACAMMNEGQQQISRRSLLRLLKLAQNELQAELQFARISPSQFIRRIDYRSSLLMQTGHEMIDGDLEEVFEFRHLTFQEYLAARGLVEGQYPGRQEERSFLELLEPHFEDERWREVIPLAAVMAGRMAEPLLRKLTTSCASRRREDHFTRPDEGWSAKAALYPATRKSRANCRITLQLWQSLDVAGEPVDIISNLYIDSKKPMPALELLLQCLLDEVQVALATLDAALKQAARHDVDMTIQDSAVRLRRGRFGEAFQDVVERAYFGGDPGWDEYRTALCDISFDQFFQDYPSLFSDEAIESLNQRLRSRDRLQQACAALVCMNLAYSNRDAKGTDRSTLVDRFRFLRDALGDLVLSDDPPVALAGAWALTWTGAARFPDSPPDGAVIRSLFRLWREADSVPLRRIAALAFSTQPLISADTLPHDGWGDCQDLFVVEPSDYFQWPAVLVLAWYRGGPWSDLELASRLSDVKEFDTFRPTARQLLALLGEDGCRILEKWDAGIERHQPTFGKPLDPRAHDD